MLLYTIKVVVVLVVMMMVMPMMPAMMVLVGTSHKIRARQRDPHTMTARRMGSATRLGSNAPITPVLLLLLLQLIMMMVKII